MSFCAEFYVICPHTDLISRQYAILHVSYKASPCSIALMFKDHRQ